VPPSFARFTIATLIVAAPLIATPLVAAEPLKESVHLTVAGGPNAGTYDKSTDRGGCSSGLVGKGVWGNQLSDPKDKDPKQFNSLQLIVPDPKKPGEFYVKIGFGPLMHRGAEYVVETRPAEKKKSGSGTVTVLDKGATAAMNFDVKTAQGVKLSGTIDCKSVIRAGGQ
jgi:hypothetical protein